VGKPTNVERLAYPLAPSQGLGGVRPSKHGGDWRKHDLGDGGWTGTAGGAGMA